MAKDVLDYKNKWQKTWIGNRSWELVEDKKRLKKIIEQEKSERIKKGKQYVLTKKTRKYRKVCDKKGKN